MTSVRTVPALRTSHTDPTLWAATAALAVLTLAGMTAQGWRIAGGGVVVCGVAIGLLVVIGASYQWSGRSDVLARVGYGTALLLALSVVVQAATYLGGSVGVPFRDAELRQLDAMLGFDWHTWSGWVSSHPRLVWLFDVAYPLHLAEMLVVGTTLAGIGQGTRFLRAFALIGGAALLGVMTVPAFGMHHDAPAFGVRTALQDGTFTTFDLFDTTGLVSMPSAHAAIAVLVVLALWRTRLRWPSLAVNAVIVVATVTVGGHYLVDVLAGVLVALGAWRVARA
jgi:membrane-associated phospholipid phosphatase